MSGGEGIAIAAGGCVRKAVKFSVNGLCGITIHFQSMPLPTCTRAGIQNQQQQFADNVYKIRGDGVEILGEQLKWDFRAAGLARNFRTFSPRIVRVKIYARGAPGQGSNFSRPLIPTYKHVPKTPPSNPTIR